MAVSDVARVLRDLPEADQERLKTVITFAKEHLSNIHRRSGENYFQHGAEVAAVLRELTGDVSLISVALLNDLLEHPEGEQLLKKSPLRPAEQELVRSMKNLRRLHIDSSTRDLDAVVRAFTGEPRLMPLRMAHRLNDIRHLERFPGAVRQSLARESLHMYAAIAGRLGLHAWRREMEEVCFPIAHGAQARTLQTQFDAHRAVDEACLKHAKTFIERVLRERGIRGEVETRIKNLYSTFCKMVTKHRKFHDLTDRLAIRILVQDVDDCYRVLGAVHGRMRPIPGKLKDYIGAPKENGYRSIHTVVFPLPGVSEQSIEIQIRTNAMHQDCEYGIANHNTYKEYAYALNVRPTRVGLFQSLASLRASARSPQKFEEALRTYFSEDRVIVFDEESNIYHLPKPATVRDFARITQPEHSKPVRTAYVNGRRQSADLPLHNGDTVDLRLTKKKHRVRSA